jgi:hypothetical protein
MLPTTPLRQLLSLLLDSFESEKQNQKVIEAIQLNAPNHACRIADVDRWNCYFDPQLMIVLSKDIEIGDELLGPD